MSVVRHALVLLLLVGACSPAAQTESPSTVAPSTIATTQASTAAPTPTALPNGLERRYGLPALVDGEADPCLPLCLTGISRAGPFEVGVRYQTKWFFGGYMTVTPARPWDAGEDSTGELALLWPGDDYGVKFALDLYPVTDGVRVAGVPKTADGLISWLRDHEDYDISTEEPASIGSLPATAIDVWNSPDAPSQYEDCLGEPCSDMFSFEQYHDNGGILGDDITRIYFADVEYGDSRHVLIAMVEGHDRTHLDRRIPAAEELLATVTVPAHAAGALITGGLAAGPLAIPKRSPGLPATRLRWSPRSSRLANPAGRDCCAAH